MVTRIILNNFFGKTGRIYLGDSGIYNTNIITGPISSGKSVLLTSLFSNFHDEQTFKAESDDSPQYLIETNRSYCDAYLNMLISSDKISEYILNNFNDVISSILPVFYLQSVNDNHIKLFKKDKLVTEDSYLSNGEVTVLSVLLGLLYIKTHIRHPVVLLIDDIDAYLDTTSVLKLLNAVTELKNTEDQIIATMKPVVLPVELNIPVYNLNEYLVR